MKYTQIPTDTFSTLQMNAGIVLADFDVTDGSFEETDLIGATSGGVNVTATPEFSDFGEDVDNCPKNMLELKHLDSWEIKVSGTLVTLKAETAKKLLGAADIAGNKITPRVDLVKTDFTDLWWVGDYSDVNTGTNAGFIAVHVMNALCTGGFQLQSGDKSKTQFAFEFTGHVSIDAQDVVPIEIYVKEGTASNANPGTGGVTH